MSHIGAFVADALARHPDRIAFVYEGQQWSYAETLATLRRLVRALAARGVGPGDGVAVLSRNRPESWLVPVAAQALGARHTPLHALGSVADHTYICTDAAVHTLIYDPRSYTDHVAAVLAGLPAGTAPQVLALGPSPDAEDVLALAAGQSATPLDHDGTPGQEDIAAVIYTGGTTGYPKGVVRPHRNLLDAASRMVDAWRWPAGARYLAAAPLTHASGLLVFPTLAQGGTVVVADGFDAERWCETVERHRVSVAFLVPTMLYALLDRVGGRLRDVRGSLELVMYGAAPTTPARIAEALDAFGPVLMQGWGQAESTMIGTMMLPGEHDPSIPGRLATCGRAMPGVGLEARDEAGKSVPDGDVGELCLSGPFVMNGYRNQPDQTAVALRDGWLHTGDVGRIDEGGWVTIVDRVKDMIISGGFNVYAREVESALAEHPAVAAAAVFGLPDPQWGEMVTAAVVRRPGATVDGDALIAHVRARKGAVQTPKRVEFVDAIPTTPLGKPDKKALRARFA